MQKAPEALAAVYENERLSYGELNARANRLAHHLIGLGVKPDQLVAICLERGLAMVVGVLAILKAGGGYLPLDPAYPPARLRKIVDDAAPRLLLCDAAGRTALGAEAVADVSVVNLDTATPVWGERPASEPRPAHAWPHIPSSRLCDLHLRLHRNAKGRRNVPRLACEFARGGWHVKTMHTSIRYPELRCVLSGNVHLLEGRWTARTCAGRDPQAVLRVARIHGKGGDRATFPPIRSIEPFCGGLGRAASEAALFK
ncbi:hypothetical protein ACVW0I_001384 [Bradyrhizobium sp. LM6.11]